MKNLIRVLFLLACLAPHATYAQDSRCISKIQARLDALGDAGKQKFNIILLEKDINAFDIGSISKVANDPLKAAAFNKIFFSLSEFVDAAGDKLSAEGMRGTGRLLPCLIKADGSHTVDQLREAFTGSGVFKGKDFDDVMKQLADDAKVTLDPANRKLTLKSSGLELTERSYGQGEQHALTHIVRGHLDNDFSVAAGKSTFRNADSIFEHLEQAWTRRGQGVQQPNGNWRFDADLSHITPAVGSSGETTIRLVVKGASGSPSSVLVTAFPVP